MPQNSQQHVIDLTRILRSTPTHLLLATIGLTKSFCLRSDDVPPAEQSVPSAARINAAPYRSHPKVGAHYSPLVAEENLPDAN
jgi:hypothetical protein